MSAAEAAPGAQASGPIQQALASREPGQLAGAERMLRGILAVEPDHFDARHLLGLICHQQGRNVEALQLVGALLKAAPVRRSCSTIAASSSRR